MTRLRTHALVLALTLLPGLAGAITFDLPHLDFPDGGAPVTKGCTHPATLNVACSVGN